MLTGRTRSVIIVSSRDVTASGGGKITSEPLFNPQSERHRGSTRDHSGSEAMGIIEVLPTSSSPNSTGISMQRHHHSMRAAAMTPGDLVVSPPRHGKLIPSSPHHVDGSPEAGHRVVPRNINTCARLLQGQTIKIFENGNVHVNNLWLRLKIAAQTPLLPNEQLQVQLAGEKLIFVHEANSTAKPHILFGQNLIGAQKTVVQAIMDGNTTMSVRDLEQQVDEMFAEATADKLQAGDEGAEKHTINHGAINDTFLVLRSCGRIIQLLSWPTEQPQVVRKGSTKEVVKVSHDVSSVLLVRTLRGEELKIEQDREALKEQRKQIGMNGSTKRQRTRGASMSAQEIRQFAGLLKCANAFAGLIQVGNGQWIAPKGLLLSHEIDRAGINRFTNVLSALAEFHSHNIMHGDIKAANLLAMMNDQGHIYAIFVDLWDLSGAMHRTVRDLEGVERVVRVLRTGVSQNPTPNHVARSLWELEVSETDKQADGEAAFALSQVRDNFAMAITLLVALQKYNGNEIGDYSIRFDLSAMMIPIGLPIKLFDEYSFAELANHFKVETKYLNGTWQCSEEPYFDDDDILMRVRENQDRRNSELEMKLGRQLTPNEAAETYKPAFDEERVRYADTELRKDGIDALYYSDEKQLMLYYRDNCVVCEQEFSIAEIAKFIEESGEGANQRMVIQYMLDKVMVEKKAKFNNNVQKIGDFANKYVRTDQRAMFLLLLSNPVRYYQQHCCTVMVSDTAVIGGDTTSYVAKPFSLRPTLLGMLRPDRLQQHNMFEAIANDSQPSTTEAPGFEVRRHGDHIIFMDDAQTAAKKAHSQELRAHHAAMELVRNKVNHGRSAAIKRRGHKSHVRKLSEARQLDLHLRRSQHQGENGDIDKSATVDRQIEEL